MRHALVATFSLLLTTMSVRADIILNGSFEQPTQAANTGTSIAPFGWEWTISTGTLLNGVAGSGFPSPQQGQQYIGLGVEGNGDRNAIQQTFTIATGGAYTLNWFDTTPIGYDTQSPYSVSLLDSFAQTVASTNLDAYHGSVDWTPRSITANFGPGDYTLLIRAEPPIGHVAAALDNFSISSVPEPSAFMLTTMGFASLVVIRSRWRRPNKSPKLTAAL